MALARETDGDLVPRVKKAQTALQIGAGPHRMAADFKDEVPPSQSGLGRRGACQYAPYRRVGRVRQDAEEGRGRSADGARS